MIDSTELEVQFPNSFSPLTTLFDHSSWNERGLKTYRCSVFPSFLTTISELVRHVDNATEKDKKVYRDRFFNFLSTICSNSLIYTKSSMDNNSYEVINQPTIEDIIKLTEKSSLNLFAPEYSIVLWGHDDFGFLILLSKDTTLDKIFIEVIAKSGLYLTV